MYSLKFELVQEYGMHLSQKKEIDKWVEKVDE